MPLGVQRDRVVRGLEAARGRVHRYSVLRWAVGVAFTLGVALLPLTDTLRIDLWGGNHRWLGEPVGLVEAVNAFAFPFLAVNVAIVLVSRFLGRYLCGFVCPYGALSRLVEWMRWRGRKRASVLRLVPVLGACLLLSLVAFSFWVDLRVFVEGSALARTVSTVLVLLPTLAFYVAVERLGLRFCRDYCPSGVYFAVLGPKTSNGIEFAHPEHCTDCHACETSCPMDLHPRELARETERPGRGFYPEGMSSHALCIRCGDCVAACEGTTARDQVPTPLRMGFLGTSDGSAEAAAEPEADDDRRAVAAPEAPPEDYHAVG